MKENEPMDKNFPIFIVFSFSKLTLIIKQMKNAGVVALLIVFGILLFPDRAIGSHAMGTDITYECLGSNQYRITVSFYRDCAGIAAPASIVLSYFSPSCGTSTGTVTLNQQSSAEVSPLCPAQLPNSTCNGGAFPGVEQYIYSAVITLPQTCYDWIISYSECCRNNAITNLQSASSFDLFAFSTINNTSGFCNNSPVFTTLPVPYVCAGVPFNYNHGAVDVDGDSLVYRLVQPSSAYLTPISYAGSASVTYPLTTTTGTFDFDVTTGQMTFTPDASQVAVLTVQVDEYRNGVLIGTTMRDIQIVVLAQNLCTNQSPYISPVINITGGGLIDSNSIQVCPNIQLTFDIAATDADGHSVIITSNASTAIPGSTFVLTGAGSSRTGTFTWFPTIADTGFHPFQITYLDDGCPVSTPQTVTFTINVFDRVEVIPDTLVYCGTPLQLNAVGGSYFIWTPAGGLSNANIYNPIATPVVPTLYHVTSDCGTDSVFIDVQPNFLFDAGNDTAICLNSLVQFNPSLDPAYGPYSYTWLPNLGLSAYQIANPIASPTVNTTYILTAVSAQGCIKKDTLTVGISGVAPSVTAYADPDTVCPGESTQLTLSTAPISCGISTTPCNTADDYTAGTGTLGTGDGTPYEGFWHDGRVLYLYRATELHALGISGGTITQIFFNIMLKESTNPFNNFTIRMSCTNLTSLSGFVSGMEVVYGPVNYSTSSGWNVHSLTNPYDWDGVSNLLVEVCFDNVAYTQDDDVYYTTTTFNSVAYDYADGSTGCTLSSPLTGTNRPNTRFSVCKQSVTGATISWTPSAHILNPTIVNPVAQVFGTTTYFADVDIGGCMGKGFVTVTVDTSVFLIAGPDTSLCLPTPIQLHATAIGTPSPILLTCGTNGTPTSATTTYTIGSAGGSSNNPTPYKGSWHDGKMQILFRKTELDALGITRGVFTSLAFNVFFKNSAASFNNFTISMGCTSLDVMGSSFESGLDVVFTPKNINTVNGWNTYVLDNVYDWDGNSNIIVQVCFDNNSYVNDDIVNITATAYTSVLSGANDFVPGGGCGVTASTGSTSRPDMRFTVSPPPAGIFTYTWSPNIALSDSLIQNPIANPVTTISYAVSVTDGICIAQDTVTITFYSGYDVNVFGTNIGCNGASDGNAVSVPNGGVPPYDFLWSTGQTTLSVFTDTLYSLVAGTYSVTLSDNNGCNSSDSVTITVPPPLDLTLSSRDISCYNGGNGFATASGSGGTTPYHFLWSNGDTNTVALSLNAGMYISTLTDASGCVDIDSIELFQPTQLLYLPSAADVSCYKYSDGNATANLSGGSPPYTYFWSDSQLTATATGLSAGIYAVTVSDDSNCVITDIIIINQPDSFEIIVNVVDVSCFNSIDGIATASVLGDTVNYSFDWNSSPPQTGATVTGLPPGIVGVMVTDTNNCSIASQAIIDAPQEIQLSVSVTDALCFDGNEGTATVSVDTGGVPPFTYIWSDAQTTDLAINLLAGEYYVTVTDSNLCEKYDTVTIAEPAPISLSDSIISPVSCFNGNDGSILISPVGGTAPYSFLWSNTQTTELAIDLAAGSYSVTVADQNNCQDSLTGITLSQPIALVFDNISTVSNCPGSETGVIAVDVFGGVSPYLFSLDGSFSQSSNEFISLPDGNYLLAATDQNDCLIDSVVNVVPFDSVVVLFDPGIVQITLGEEAVLMPLINPQDSVNYTFSWNSTSGVDDLSCNSCINPVASPNITTVYDFTVTDANGCPYTATVTVEVANDLILVVPNAFSPNGDGINDILLVYGIAIQEVDFKIFNRWGEKIFTTTNKDGGWDGTYKGKVMPPDVYVYYVEAVYEDGQEKAIKGSVTIVK